MLSKPYAGWTALKFKNFYERISHLSDIPLDWTKAFKIYLEHIIKNNLEDTVPLIIIADCEDYDLRIIATPYYLDFHTDGDYLGIKNHFNTFDYSVFDFMQYACLDFIRYIDKWVEWIPAFGHIEEIVPSIRSERKKQILETITKVKNLLVEIKAKHFKQMNILL